MTSNSEQVYYEDGPTHTLTHVGDVVTEWRSGNRPLTIRTIYHCELCPVVRTDIVDVPTWSIRSSGYYYPPGVRVERGTAKDRRKKKFLAETNLPLDVIQKLKEE